MSNPGLVGLSVSSNVLVPPWVAIDIGSRHFSVLYDAGHRAILVQLTEFQESPTVTMTTKNPFSAWGQGRVQYRLQPVCGGAVPPPSGERRAEGYTTPSPGGGAVPFSGLGAPVPPLAEDHRVPIFLAVVHSGRQVSPFPSRTCSTQQLVPDS